MKRSLHLEIEPGGAGLLVGPSRSAPRPASNFSRRLLVGRAAVGAAERHNLPSPDGAIVTTTEMGISMSRLTKMDRDKIVSDLLKHKFGAIQDEITKEFVALGSVIVEQVKIQDADHYPRGWFARRDSFKISAAGESAGYIEFNHIHGKTVYKVKKRWAWNYLHYAEVALPYCHRDGDIRLGVDSKFTPMLEDLGARCIAYLEEYEAAETLARRTISKFSTAKSLVKAWPEIEPFVPVAAVSSGNLPALQVDEMNKIFGLKA